MPIQFYFYELGEFSNALRLQPKIGLLGMIVDPILYGVVEDAYIVPVSIYYDGDLWLQNETRNKMKQAHFVIETKQHKTTNCSRSSDVATLWCATCASYGNRFPR